MTEVGIEPTISVREVLDIIRPIGCIDAFFKPASCGDNLSLEPHYAGLSGLPVSAIF
jgi:hypothetical protein